MLEKQEQTVQMVQKDHKVQQVTMVLQEQKVQQVRRVSRVFKESLDY
jgi:hypothetical protein